MARLPARAFAFSPLYDLSSQLPYPELIEQRVAMKIGDHYDIPLIELTDWRTLASASSVNLEILMSRLHQLCDTLPDVICAARDRALTNGLDREVITTLATLLIRHVKTRRVSLNETPSRRRRVRKSIG